ncbi:MAG: aldolase/citrate lyase family protein [Pseudomonadota bacterium]
MIRPPRAKLEAAVGPLPAAVCWLGLPTAASARIAALAGYRLATIDTEHAAIGPETAAAMILALRGEGAAALVRVSGLATGPIQHALDSGATGIIVPYVETVAAAEAAVRAFHFPPLGARGQAAAVVAATGYGTDAGYGERWADTGLLALQIESRAGLAAARAIAAVPGVDMLFFGPFDYAQDAGLDPATDGAVLAAAFADIVAAAHAADRLAGVFPWPGASEADLAGADMVARASDIVTLRLGLQATLP